MRKRTESLSISLVVMSCLLLWELFPTLCAALQVYTSTSTPAYLPQVLATALQELRPPQLLTPGLFSDIHCSDGEIVLDYTYDRLLSHSLQIHTQKCRYLLMWPPAFTTEPTYAVAFSHYAQILNLTDISLITTTETHQIEAANTLLAAFPTLYSEPLIVPFQASLQFCVQFLRKQAKPHGLHYFAIFTDPLAAFNLLTAFQQVHMVSEGFVFLLSEESAQFRYLNRDLEGLLDSGVLIVDSKACEADSIVEYEVIKLGQMLNSTDNWPNLYCLVGKIARFIGNLTVFYKERMLLPGNASSIHRGAKVKIVASVNYLTTASLSFSSARMRGFEVAFQDINAQNDLIPGYYMQDNPVAWTDYDFDYNTTRGNIEANRGQLGVIYFPLPSSGSMIGISQVFADLNVSMPMAGDSVSTILSSPHAYPLFVRSRVSNEYIFRTVCAMLKHFEWREIAVIYSADEGDNEDAYQQFAALAPLYGLNITNKEENRRLPGHLTENDTAVVKAALREIMALPTRVIVQITLYNEVIADALYSLDIRNEYALVLGMGLHPSFFFSPEQLPRRVVSKGALWFVPSTFVGKVGSRIKQQLLEVDGNNIYYPTCFMYDAAYLFFHAMDYLLTNSLEYESAHTLIRAMRGSFFQGCSGLVRIGSDSNDKDQQTMDILNFQYDLKADTWEIKPVGTYNAFSMSPITLTSKIQWPDDAESFSNLKPMYKQCPYLAHTVKKAESSQSLGLVISFVLAFVCSAAIVVIWRKWWTSSLTPLATPQAMQLEDLLIILTIPCDFMQFAALSPSAEPFNALLSLICASVGVQVEGLMTTAQGGYWTALNTALGCVALWTLVSIGKFTGLLEKISSGVDYWSEVALPFLCNASFIPLISIISSVFLCYNATSSALTDSFLNADCYERCWQGWHFAYALSSGLILVLFIPFSVFTRPLWQGLQRAGNVKQSPPALMLKSQVQLALVTVSTTLQTQYPQAHAAVFFTLMSAFAVSTCLIKHFNYERMNLWYGLAMQGVLLYTLCGYLSNYVESASVIWLAIACLAVCVLLVITGIVLQLLLPRFASKLYRRKPKDLRGLFTFAFTGGQRAAAALSRHYTINETVQREGVPEHSGNFPSSMGLQ